MFFIEWTLKASLQEDELVGGCGRVLSVGKAELAVVMRSRPGTREEQHSRRADMGGRERSADRTVLGAQPGSQARGVRVMPSS